MTVLTECDLQITITDAVCARKFDGDCHGLSHCMKAVDFIVEFPDRYLFIEFKDPQDPNASKEKRKEFIERFKTGRMDNDLTRKYRDSFLYEWASGRADKPVDYLVLVALDSLDTGSLTQRTDALKRNLPVKGPRNLPWPRPIARNCAVFNIEAWNRYLPEYPIERRSESR